MKTEVSKKHIMGLLLVLLAVFCMSVAPILIKVGIAANIAPVTLLSFRMITGAATLWFVYLILWPHNLHIDVSGLMHCAFVAMANCTCSICFIFALTRIDAAVASVIVSFYPAIVLILLSLRRERTTRGDLLRLALMIIGVYLVIGPGGHVDLIGIFFVIVAAISYAFYLVFIQWYLSAYNSRTIALYVVTFMALFMSIVLLTFPTSWDFPSPNGWAVLLSLGIISTALARIAIFAGIHIIGSRQTAMLGGPLEPLFTVLLAMVVLNEHMSIIQIIGALTIVGSALPAIWRDRRFIDSVRDKPKYI
jgi:drug/metabolite transporter (DMT)-like permease